MDLNGVVDAATRLRSSKPPSLSVIIGVEGFGGSGKSTFAARLEEALPGLYVIHLDEFLVKGRVAERSWVDGMFDRHRLEEQVLVPASTGQPLSHQRLLWDEESLSEPLAVLPQRFLIVEGIAAYFGELEHYYDLRVWIDVPIDVAADRGRARDGSTENAGLWDVWRANDLTYWRAHRPDLRADLVVSGHPERPLVLVETARMTLRRFAPGDVDNLVALDADPEVMFFVTGGIPTDRSEIEEAVLPRWLAYDRTSPVLGFWAAEETASDEFLGWFHLVPRDGAPPGELELELGYRLRRTAWGRGLATEGSRALIELAFTTAGASRVVAETMVAHAASRRVMEKSGMTLVRVFRADWPYRIPGDELGDVEYSLRRDDWASSVQEDAQRVADDAVERRGHLSPPASV